MSEVKTYEIRGTAVFNVSRFPTRQKFVKYIRALNERQALEKLYSDFGSKNKIKRSNIKVEEIKEVNPEHVPNKYIRDISKLNKIIM